LIAQE